MDWPRAGPGQNALSQRASRTADCLASQSSLNMARGLIVIRVALFLPVSACFRLGSPIVQSILQSGRTVPLSDWRNEARERLSDRSRCGLWRRFLFPRRLLHPFRRGTALCLLGFLRHVQPPNGSKTRTPHTAAYLIMNGSAVVHGKRTLAKHRLARVWNVEENRHARN